MIIAIITIHLSTILDTVLETKVLAINVKANVSNPFGPVGIIIISAWMCRGKAHLHLAMPPFTRLQQFNCQLAIYPITPLLPAPFS